MSLCSGEYPCQVSTNFVNKRSLRQHLFALCKYLVYTIKEEKNYAKRNGLCCFDKVMQDGHIHLTAFETIYLVNKVQHGLLDMNRDGF